jgi:hypothetical protein
MGNTRINLFTWPMAGLFGEWPVGILGEHRGGSLDSLWHRRVAPGRGSLYGGGSGGGVTPMSVNLVPLVARSRVVAAGGRCSSRVAIPYFPLLREHI